MLSSPAVICFHADMFSLVHHRWMFQIRKRGKATGWSLSSVHAGMAVKRQSRQKWLFLLCHCMNVGIYCSCEATLKLQTMERFNNSSAHTSELSSSPGRVRWNVYVCTLHRKWQRYDRNLCEDSMETILMSLAKLTCRVVILKLQTVIWMNKVEADVCIVNYFERLK